MAVTTVRAVTAVLAVVAAAVASSACYAAVLPAASARSHSTQPEVCARAAPAVWPGSVAARRDQIARLAVAVRQCMEEPDLLAVLGALYLEDGDAAQALIWLERALLLDPGNLGAQADHALALADLGEPAALAELSQQWRTRSDIPAALRSKLFPSNPSSDPRLAYALPSARLGQAERQTFGVQGDISALFGFEDNLDRSPRLSELTLSVPDGSFVLPVTSQPRKGRASLGTAGLQVAYAPAPGTVLRTGVQLNARRATAQQSTDWQQALWSLEWVQRGSWWRAQADAAYAWFGGPLNEPYHLRRTAGALEMSVWACAAKLTHIREQRKQETTFTLDAETKLWVTSLQCPLPYAPSWSASVSVNRGEDRPRSSERPGGLQQLSARVFRLSGSLGAGTTVDLSVRSNDVRDAEGYSVLLENNAIRQIQLRQTSVEIAQSLKPWGWTGLVATLQWQSARQTSNLPLFAYRADTVYGGLRWNW